MNSRLAALKSFACAAAVALVLAAAPAPALAATPSVDRLLDAQVNALPLGLTPVVITYDHQPGTADLLALRSLGILRGTTLRELPMVLTVVTKAQLQALKTRPGVVSLYAN